MSARSLERPDRLFGVLVTFNRPGPLALTLKRLAEQERPLDELVVIDNAPDESSRRVVREAAAPFPIEHVEMSENVGFTGGVSAGMLHVLDRADPEDWVVVFDDDDPVPYPTVVADLERFAIEMRASDPRTAAVGITGGRFDWKRGRIQRVPDAELDGPVVVDHVAGNQIPFFLVEAIRSVGPFYAPLFFGLSELEFGLRLSRAGYSLYAHGDLWRRRRTEAGRLALDASPAWRVGPWNWRRYYVLRNSIFMLRAFGHGRTAIRVACANLAKAVVNLPLRPRLAARHLAFNVKACADGWAGRMGMRVQPGSDARHSRKAGATKASEPEGVATKG
jgi:glycosyltransferase involved in cell wall biosynthesis